MRLGKILGSPTLLCSEAQNLVDEKLNIGLIIDVSSLESTSGFKQMIKNLSPDFKITQKAKDSFIKNTILCRDTFRGLKFFKIIETIVEKEDLIELSKINENQFKIKTISRSARLMIDFPPPLDTINFYIQERIRQFISLNNLKEGFTSFNEVLLLLITNIAKIEDFELSNKWMIKDVKLIESKINNFLDNQEKIENILFFETIEAYQFIYKQFSKNTGLNDPKDYNLNRFLNKIEKYEKELLEEYELMDSVLLSTEAVNLVNLVNASHFYR